MATPKSTSKKLESEFKLSSYLPLTLDRSILSLSPEELSFFQLKTGIEDEQKLKEHIFNVQEKAFKVTPYPCIRHFEFTKLRISRSPAYPKMLDLVKTRPDAIYLDVGCCFGNDARKAVADGWPMGNVICADLNAPFWDLGHELFCDKETFPVPFLAGDVFDPCFLSPTIVQKTGPRPALTTVNRLTELQGEISVIHASFFFHLFGGEDQTQLAGLLITLLLKQPGSMIFGSQVGQSQAGPYAGGRGYGHSPESWREMWEEEIGKGKCEVEATIEFFPGYPGDPRGDRELLVWSVVLL